MGPLRLSNPVTITRARPQFDSRGNRTDTVPTLDLQAVVSVTPALTRPRLQEGGENRFIQDAAVWVRRGSDLRPGDEITYNGAKFIIAGHARGDQVHPMTGTNFGLMSFQAQGFG